MAVGTGQVRCGVMARDWEGIALPDFRPNRFDWVCHGRCESEKGTEDYLYTERNSGITRTVRKFSLTLFWYLWDYEAYNVLAKESAPIGWLFPFEGSAFHEADPERFPDPLFMVLVPEHPVINAADLVFVTADLKNRQPAITPETTLSDAPQGKAETSLLQFVLALAKKTKCDLTHPYSEDNVAKLEAAGIRLEKKTIGNYLKMAAKLDDSL